MGRRGPGREIAQDGRPGMSEGPTWPRLGARLGAVVTIQPLTPKGCKKPATTVIADETLEHEAEA